MDPNEAFVKQKYPQAACVEVKEGGGLFTEIWTGGKFGSGLRLEFCPLGLVDSTWAHAANNIRSGFDEKLKEGGGIKEEFLKEVF